VLSVVAIAPIEPNPNLTRLPRDPFHPEVPHRCDHAIPIPAPNCFLVVDKITLILPGGCPRPPLRATAPDSPRRDQRAGLDRDGFVLTSPLAAARAREAPLFRCTRLPPQADGAIIQRQPSITRRPGVMTMSFGSRWDAAWRRCQGEPLESQLSHVAGDDERGEPLDDARP
jgi:hypothetical protein